ncbi:hypothetical protein S40293_10388 [Stachybotrys chartarum IBT 40293]|nr:hypothetical protein S40293_10388 [Stachybotrys chartarum IBT 40293]
MASFKAIVSTTPLEARPKGVVPKPSLSMDYETFKQLLDDQETLDILLDRMYALRYIHKYRSFFDNNIASAFRDAFQCHEQKLGLNEEITQAFFRKLLEEVERDRDMRERYIDSLGLIMAPEPDLTNVLMPTCHQLASIVHQRDDPELPQWIEDYVEHSAKQPQDEEAGLGHSCWTGYLQLVEELGYELEMVAPRLCGQSGEMLHLQALIAGGVAWYRASIIAEMKEMKNEEATVVTMRV